MIDFIAQNSALDSRMWLLVRYEDLVRTPLEAFARILAFLGIDSRSVDLTRLNAVPVWGSSFLGHTSGKWEWGVAAREQGFRPIGRWRSWPVDRQRDFIANAGSELRAFGYETSGLGPESGEGGTG